MVLTATPNAGASFAGWTDCPAPNNLICNVTMDQPRTVFALFTTAGLPVPQWFEIHPENVPQQ